MSPHQEEVRSPGNDAGRFLRPFIHGCIPSRSRAKTAGGWTRRYGPAEFRVTPHPGLGIPRGQDRLILLLVARAVVEQQQRRIVLGTASQILKTLGLPPDGRNYQRLARRFERVLGARMVCTYWRKVDGKATVARTAEIHFEDLHLWYRRPKGTAEPARFENSLTVSEGFWEEMQRNPAQVDMAVVRALSNAPRNLTFYLWLCLCSHTAWPDHVTQIPLHGPLGLKRRLGISGYHQQRDFARHARRWLERVQALWTGCPATLAKDGDVILVHNILEGLSSPSESVS
jgi:Replication initiator protein A